jgi:hypothetical protein
VVGVHTGESGHEPPGWFADALTVAADLVLVRNERHLLRRPVPLVALPLIGTGRGGADERRSGALEELLDRARTLADRGVDVVLVLANRQAYSAAQRLRVVDQEGELWRRTLTDTEMTLATELALNARSGKLVPFLGAGVSAAAGLPGWRELLGKLAAPAGLCTSMELEELERMDPRDAARVIQQRLGGPGGELDSLLRAQFSDAERASLTHALLGSLPIHEAATTNYDRLFENAWGAAAGGPARDARKQVTVLPRDDASGARRWLVKLHGDVDDPHPERKLVLSRDDYRRFEQHGGAIAGVLHAMLLTRHVLIVGYGLRDETFHRIAHEVRELGASKVAIALAERHHRQLGTALLVHPPGLFGEVWSADPQLADMSGGHHDIPAAARRQDILLDRVGVLASPVESYVLGAGWGELSAPGLTNNCGRHSKRWSAYRTSTRPCSARWMTCCCGSAATSLRKPSSCIASRTSTSFDGPRQSLTAISPSKSPRQQQALDLRGSEGLGADVRRSTESPRGGAVTTMA